MHARPGAIVLLLAALTSVACAADAPHLDAPSTAAIESQTASPVGAPPDRSFSLAANPNLWVVDVQSGPVISLLDRLQSAERFSTIDRGVHGASFETDDNIHWIRSDLQLIHYLSPDGLLIRAEPLSPRTGVATSRCLPTNDGSLIDGKPYPAVGCWDFAPNGTRLLYRRMEQECSQSPVSVDLWACRILDLAEGADGLLRRDQSGCGVG